VPKIGLKEVDFNTIESTWKKLNQRTRKRIMSITGLEEENIGGAGRFSRQQIKRNVFQI